MAEDEYRDEDTDEDDTDQDQYGGGESEIDPVEQTERVDEDDEGGNEES